MAHFVFWGDLPIFSQLLTFRRRGGRWSANIISKSSQAVERKAPAAVRCDLRQKDCYPEAGDWFW
jgi:hypothetical protein